LTWSRCKRVRAANPHREAVAMVVWARGWTADLQRESSMNEVSIISGIVGAGMVLLFIRLSTLERRLNRLSRLDALSSSF
jgi:hypothetical protein